MEFGAYEHAANGESVTYALGLCNNVGAYAGPLVGKELAAAPATALYLVEYECGACGVALLLEFLQKLGIGYSYSSHSLYALDDDGCYVALCKFGTHCLNVVERQIRGVSVVIYGGYYLWVVGYLHSKRCAAVECLVEGNDTGAAVLERRQLQRIFVGLGSRVYEKEVVILVTAYLAQRFCHLALQGVYHRIRVEAKRAHLPAYVIDIFGVCVAY